MSRNGSITLDNRLQTGTRFLVFLAEKHGQDVADALLAARRTDAKLRMPRSIYRDYCEEVWKMTYSAQRRTALARAFEEIARRRPNGTGQLALRAGQQGNARRAPGGGPKCLAFGLSHSLLQFFVDEVQQLYCRADSTLLMNHARALRQHLVDSGMPEHEVPILTGNAGAKWFARWRLEYRIVTKVCALQMKVSWSKVKKRTRVLFLNIFKLRELWR